MFVTPVNAPDTFADPLNDCPQMVRAVCKVVAVVALPVSAALMVAGSFRFTFAPPLTDTVTAVPVPSLFTMPTLRAVPQFAVVIFADPSKEVPLMVCAVSSLEAEATLSVVLANLYQPIYIPVFLPYVVL